MDLESESSVLESVDDNEEIKDVIVSDKLENIQNNGSYVVENGGNGGIKDRGTEVSGSVNSPPMDVKVGSSPSPTTTRKGFGLKKWRRIRRDVNKGGGDSVVDTAIPVTQELSNSRGNPSKRMQVHPETKQKSEGSVSSTNAVVRSMGGFALLDDSGLVVGPSFAAGTDSENSEDRSSKSSTAASAPKLNLEIPVVVAGFPRDKGKLRSSSGKNLTHSAQRGHQGKGRVETTKKARGEWVKIEKENSHSSMESDSRSSNFVFVQGIYPISNGIRSNRPVDYDGENGDEVQGSAHQVSEELQVDYGRDGEGGYENAPEALVADSYWELKAERNENHGSSLNEDPLTESILALQSAQEALEKEVLKFKQINEGDLVDLSSSLGSELVDVQQNSKEPISEKFPSSSVVQLELLETEKKEADTELEKLFKQKIEAEVEYLAISRKLQSMRAAAVDQITGSEDHKTLASERAQMTDNLEGMKSKADRPKLESKKLENNREDIVTADETLKLQTRVCKYTSCFFLQLLLFVVILGVFIVQLSPNSGGIVPT